MTAVAYSNGVRDDDGALSLSGKLVSKDDGGYGTIGDGGGTAALMATEQSQHEPVQHIRAAQCRRGLLGLADRIGSKFFPLGYWREFREILKLHLPAFLTCFFQFFLQTISVIMCGHLSKEQLDAVALACTLINVAALSIGLGLSTGCDTYFAQTYGSQHKKRVGLYLQRSFIVMYMFLVPVYCILLNIKPILLLLGQDPIISDMTARYILIFLPGVFFDYTFLVLARYLQTQNRVNPPLICALIGNVFNAVTQYVAVYVLGFQYEASAACQAASLVVMCVCMLLYIRVSRAYEDTWDGWTVEAVYDIGGFIKLAVPGLLLVSLENVSFEIGTFVAGNISLVQLGAQAILFQSSALLYMVCLGMSIAVNIRVGQHLGAGRIEPAKHTCKVAITIILCTSTVICIFFSTCAEQIASIFTSDAAVKAATVELIAVYAPFPFVDGLSATASGVLKGSGRQLIGAAFNLVAYDLIALPIGLPLSLLTWLQMRGFWIGMLTGLSIETVIFWTIIWRTNWRKMVADAKVRAAGKVEVEAAEDLIHDLEGPHQRDDDQTQPLLSSDGHRRRRSHVRTTSKIYASPYESDIELDVRAPLSLPPLGPVLRVRLATCLCLFVCLAAAIALRTFQDTYLPLRWTQLCLPVVAGNGTAAALAAGVNFTQCSGP